MPDAGGAESALALDDLPVAGANLDALRRARRRRRIAGIHWVDALYRVYMTALIGTISVILLAGAIGDTPLTPAQVDDVARYGPAFVGLVASLAVMAGLRSGSRGGPLALERADVRHVLLAPVDRGRALRSPALRQLRTGLFVAVVVGAVVGLFSEQRLPENRAAWVVAGAATAATIVALTLGSALVASGRHLHRWVATSVGGVLVVWSALDLLELELGDVSVPASPGRAVGWIALSPLDLHEASLAAVAVAVVLLAAGLAWVGRLSVERAERRTALVGQMRFAATLQDVRTVMVLRRQLTADQPRPRPWIRIGPGPTAHPVWRRGWNGILRFPVPRVLRLIALTLVAALALRATWAGTTPVVVVVGLALWLVGLDLVEPLAQEADHPSRRTLYRDEEGQLYVRLLSASVVVAVLLGLLSGGLAAVPGWGQVPPGPALLAGVITALTGVAGGVTSVLAGAPSTDPDLSLIAPEVAGLKVALRAAIPPVIAVVGALPLLFARADHEAGDPMLDRATPAWLAAVTVVFVVFAWVQQREAIRQWWNDAMEANAALRGAGAGDGGDGGDGDDGDHDGGHDGDDDEERS